jgi:hypothetical protein
MSDNLQQMIQDFHDSEINAEIGWFYDGVWWVKIGDELNGFGGEERCRSLAEASEWLRVTPFGPIPTASWPSDIAEDSSDDLTDEERQAVIYALKAEINCDRFPHSPRLAPLRLAPAKIDPASVPRPLPELGDASSRVAFTRHRKYGPQL